MPAGRSASAARQRPDAGRPATLARVTSVRRAATPLLLALAFVGGALPGVPPRVRGLAGDRHARLVRDAGLPALRRDLLPAHAAPHPRHGRGGGAGGLLGGRLPGGRGALVGPRRPRSSSRRRGRRAPVSARFLLGVPLLALQGVYFEGPALWPEPFLAPFPLAATLLLERWERRGRPRRPRVRRPRPRTRRPRQADVRVVRPGGVPLARPRKPPAVPAVPPRSWRPESRRPISPSLSSGESPSERRGTSGGRSSTSSSGTTRARSRSLPDLALANEAVAPYLALLALGAPARGALVTPAPLPARSARPRRVRHGLAALGAPPPRGGAGAPRPGDVARPEPPPGPGAPPSLAGGASRRRGLLAADRRGLSLLTNVAVALVGAGPLLLDAVGGPARFWDDETARGVGRAGEGEDAAGRTALRLRGPPRDPLPADGHGDARRLLREPVVLVLPEQGRPRREARFESLRGRPDVPILFREPPEGRDGDELRRTKTYRTLVEETAMTETVDALTSWRRARLPAR